MIIGCIYLHIHIHVWVYIYIHIYIYIYDAQFLFKVWATGQWKIGECVIVSQFSGYMLSLSFVVSVLSFFNQNPCITNPMSIPYISLMTDIKNHTSYIHTNSCSCGAYFKTAE